MRLISRAGVVALIAAGLTSLAATSANAAPSASAPAPVSPAAIASLSWGNFPNVSSEDRIDVFVTPNRVAVGDIEICLESAPYITAWKGIEAVGFNGSYYDEVDTAGTNHGPNCMILHLVDVDHIEFWKAKFLGIHKHKYDLDQYYLQQRSGSRVTFRWEND
jgi:hypothetical protein